MIESTEETTGGCCSQILQPLDDDRFVVAHTDTFEEYLETIYNNGGAKASKFRC